MSMHRYPISMLQQKARVGFWPGFMCVMLALAVTLAMSLHGGHFGELSNPDTFMRLVRLRDMLDRGSIVYDVARDGSGHGTELHWSHLIDGLLCLLALPFRLVLNRDDALHEAALIFGPLNM